jgi:hypothetical protein
MGFSGRYCTCRILQKEGTQRRQRKSFLAVRYKCLYSVKATNPLCCDLIIIPNEHQKNGQ